MAEERRLRYAWDIHWGERDTHISGIRIGTRREREKTVKGYIETFDSGETKKIWNDIKDCFYVIIIDWVFPIIYSGRDMPQYELVTQSICHLTNDDGVF